MDESAARARGESPGQTPPDAEDSSEQNRNYDKSAEENRLAYFGVKSQKALDLILTKTTLSVGAKSHEDIKQINFALNELLSEAKPSNPLEAMLISQMVTSHFAALNLMNTAMLRDQDYRVVDKSIAQATKFMQLFVRQLEALSKLRGMSQEQKSATDEV